MNWEELREEEFDTAIEESKGVCVIPIGCLEMHGQHLPVGTDNYEAEHIAKLAAEIEPVCIFPTFRFGDVMDLVKWKGSIRLEPHLLSQLLENLCDEIARNGFKKILFLNHHGGNIIMLNNFQRGMAYKKRPYLVMACNAYSGAGIVSVWDDIQKHGRDFYPELLPEDVDTIERFVTQGLVYGHGGIEETSQTLDIRPDLVKMERRNVVSGLSTNKSDKYTMDGKGMYGLTFWKQDFPNSYTADDPQGSSARIGKLLNRLMSEQVARVYKVYKESDEIVAWNEEYNSYFPEWM